MIKYFCDFCKKEITMTMIKPETEIGVTINKQLNVGNRTTQKVEHICTDCNAQLIGNLTTMGLEV